MSECKPLRIHHTVQGIVICCQALEPREHQKRNHHRDHGIINKHTHAVLDSRRNDQH